MLLLCNFIVSIKALDGGLPIDVLLFKVYKKNRKLKKLCLLIINLLLQIPLCMNYLQFQEQSLYKQISIN